MNIEKTAEKLTNIWNVVKINTLYRATVIRSEKKLAALAWRRSGVSLDELKETLTDPDVVKISQICSSSSSTHREYVSGIIRKCVRDLPNKDILPLAEFLVDNDVTNEVIRYPDDRFTRDVGYCLSLIMGKTPPKEKGAMADILAKDDFGRILLGKTNPIDITRSLSDGLSPQEFDNILSSTKLMADRPHDENTEDLLIDENLINKIALDALLRSKPHLREHESIRSKISPSIDEVCDDEAEKQLFIEQAEEIVRIAFLHCKGTTKKHEKKVIPDKKRWFSYIENNLMNDESIVYRANLHWIIFLWPIVWFLVAIIIIAAGIGVEAVKDAAFVASIPLLFAILTGIRPFIKYSTSEFGITNKRVIIKVGFIRRDSLEALLDRVANIHVSQDVLGRFLNYGSIIVTTGGTESPFHKIESPLEFRKKVQEQITVVQDTK